MEQNCSDAETWHFSQLLLWDSVCAISVCGRALLKVSLRSLRCISSISAGQLLTYQLITPDILISKQSLSLWTLINFVGFGLFGGFLLVCFGFVVCCFFFFKSQWMWDLLVLTHRLCMSTPNYQGYACRSPAGMYVGMTCHFAFNSTCCSLFWDLLCAVIFLLQKTLCWWKLKSSLIKMDRNTLPCWIPGRLHGRVVQNFRSEEGRRWSWESHGENLHTSFILRSLEWSE